MHSPVTRLAACFPVALLSPAAFPLLSRQTIGGRRLGGSGRVLLFHRQLPFQIGDLFFGIGEPLFCFGDSFGLSCALLAELLPQQFHLLAQPLIFPMQRVWIR